LGGHKKNERNNEEWRWDLFPVSDNESGGIGGCTLFYTSERERGEKCQQ